MTSTIAAVLAFVFGLPIGSFLNVVIWRVPRNESVVKPPSHCPGCDNEIAPFDNIPLVSWLLLRGKCRHCTTRISIRYPLIELLTALLFALIGARFAHSATVFGLLLFAAALVALCAIDLEHMLLPNHVIYPTAALVIPAFAIGAAVDGTWSSFGRAVLGGLAAFAGFYAIWFVAPRAMGFGDVRLSALLGFVAAYFGWPVLGAAMLLPFLLGSVGGIAIAAPVVLIPMGAVGAVGYAYGERFMSRLANAPVDDPTRARLTVAAAAAIFSGALVFLVLGRIGKVQRGRHIPFGPYLAAGCLLAVILHGAA